MNQTTKVAEAVADVDVDVEARIVVAAKASNA